MPRQQADGTVAVMVLNMNATSGGSRTVNVSINGDTLSEDGVRYQTNGDTALSMTNLNNLGNSFSTTIAGRTLQVFVIPALPGLPGDYNDDGSVDAADYTVWRDNLDTSNTLPNDATPGSVDQADYGVWQANFGRSLASGAGSPADGLASVPEPSGGLLIVLAMASLGVLRTGGSRSRCSRRPTGATVTG